MVTSEQLGKAISVTVTDAEGNTAESEDTELVTPKDLSVEVTIEDLDGLQEDGSALPTDTLHLSYGAALGTPESIIWYKDGAALKVNTARGGFAGAFDTIPRAVAGTASKARGEWYVIVQNTDGENFVSNSIIVTPEDAAIMSGVTITEDYDTPSIEYTKTTSSTVVTVELNKDYAGTFYLAPDAKTTFYNKADLKNEIKTTEMTTKTKFKDMTDKNAVAQFATDSTGLKYVDDETGEVLYKFVVKMDNTNGVAVKRGSDYNLIFDQDDIDEDDLETASGKGTLDDLSLNISEAVTVPYVEAPASIGVELYAKAAGAAATIKVGLYDEEGDALAWYDQANNAGALQGFSSVKVFNTANNAVAATDTACTGPSAGVAEDGVITLTYTGTNTQFAYVTLSTTAGVFAAASEDLTTPVVETVAGALDSLTVKQGSDPVDAKIEFKNLTKRGSGTVYLFQSNLAVGATTNDDTTETTNTNIVAQNKAGAWMIGSATVEGGSSSVTIPGVFDKAVIGATGTDKYQDYYAALFVPDDTEYYAQSTSATFQLKHELKSYALNGTYEGQTAAVLAAGLAKAIRGVDQFGDKFELDATTGATLASASEAAGDATTFDDSLTAVAGAATVYAAFTNAGNITVTIAGQTATGGEAVKGTTHEVSLPGGQKLVITCDKTNTTASDGTFKLAIK